jgi:hypothetical protein
MFSIEHEFDSTVVTLVDENSTPLQEDGVINLFEDCITIEQYDERSDRGQKITLSINMAEDLAAAWDLPEGVYKIARD